MQGPCLNLTLSGHSPAPMTFLPFIAKTLVREICSHSPCFFSSFLLNTFQSDHRSNVSRTTVFVRVIDNFHFAKSEDQFSALILFDLLATFDTVDHFLSLKHLYFFTVLDSETPISPQVLLLPSSLPSVLLCWFLLVLLNSEHGSALGLTLGTSSSLLYVHSLAISSSPLTLNTFYMPMIAKFLSSASTFLLKSRFK